jgi:hypothetical protein
VTAASEAFIKLPRDLLESEAWRRLSINAWRLLNFLMIQHMKHGGKGNGRLLAPRRQLEISGIGAHHVSPAIEECEGAGLIDCIRGVGRQPNVYALTWLPLVGGAPASNRWRVCRSEDSKKTRASDCQTAVTKNDCQTAAHEYCQTAVTKAVATAKQQSQRPKMSTAKQQHPSRKESYHGGANSEGIREQGEVKRLRERGPGVPVP